VKERGLRIDEGGTCYEPGDAWALSARCRSAFKSKNGQFVDIKSDNDGNKPSNLIDAHSGREGRRGDNATADWRGPSARLPAHRVALRGGHRWPELLERVFGAMPWAQAPAAAPEQGDDRADQTQALTDGQEHPGPTAAAAQAWELPSPVWHVLREHRSCRPARKA
jgi:hypothetical protein